ncbi:2OG-Fe(II) oxygenase [Nostoc sp. GT001]|uniref:2OG-Fe(II) oxygenase n=1 Tax=Nostoc sp. GT001 TaxID=3056647 RepID=UPI0025AA6857|nr:2OG-Fe(II) oxygenase [Nostoc sp. GT001]MDM9585832.1 2OG-Fe(II) oxygenase [Nostoc sp. GT001]
MWYWLKQGNKPDLGVLENSAMTYVKNDLWLTVTADLLANYPDAVNRIYKGEIDGMLIKQVFTKEEMLKAKHQLENIKSRKSVGYGESFGVVLPAKENEPTKYFQDVNVYRNDLKNIFEGGYEQRIEGLLSKVSGGRVVEIASENNQTYAPAQIRFVEPNKGGIIIHKGSQFLQHPSFAHLTKIARLQEHLSYFLIVDKPEEGGELIIYDLPPEEAKKDFDTLVKDSAFEKCDKKYISPDIGDMVLFHGGTIWHKVAEARGNKNRISIGGFVAISTDDQKIFYWS